jgi:hypothetical protein
MWDEEAYVMERGAAEIERRVDQGALEADHVNGENSEQKRAVKRI